jgi:aminoglycoside 6'-N-acetyltransferase I
MKVERVTAATMGDWIALRAVLWPEASEADLKREAPALLGRERGAVVFIVRDGAGTAIGFAEATVRVDYVNGCTTSPVGFLEGIYVRADWRRRGAARLLVRAVEAWARECGCSELASDTEIENEQSQRMDEALGFEESERVVCYHKRIS